MRKNLPRTEKSCFRLLQESALSDMRILPLPTLHDYFGVYLLDNILWTYCLLWLCESRFGARRKSCCSGHPTRHHLVIYKPVLFSCVWFWWRWTSGRFLFGGWRLSLYFVLSSLVLRRIATYYYTSNIKTSLILLCSI